MLAGVDDPVAYGLCLLAGYATVVAGPRPSGSPHGRPGAASRRWFLAGRRAGS